MAIPKIIHYCWLSQDPVPDNYQKCMASWREKLPEYDYILWDTARFDINALTWTRQAFDVGLYAFAADYIRLYAVYHHGGIYLDMDMEVVKPFGDLLEAGIMLGRESPVSDNIEAGCFGAEAGHPYIKKCMEYYEERDFFPEERLEDIKKMTKEQKNATINLLIGRLGYIPRPLGRFRLSTLRMSLTSVLLGYVPQPV